MASRRKAREAALKVLYLKESRGISIRDAFDEMSAVDDEIAKMRAAKAWSAWKAKCASLEPNEPYFKWLQQPSLAMSLARLECHYLIHNNFLEPNQIIKNLNSIAHIPGIVIHGRYDMICPFNNAWILHNAWPQSNLRIIPNAGHNATEITIVDAIIHASNEMRKWS